MTMKRSQIPNHTSQAIKKRFHLRNWNLGFRAWSLSRGFTLPEFILTLGILTVLFSIIAISLSYVDQRTASGTKISVVTTDIKGQQIKAMTGEAGMSGTLADHGIYFEQDKYTLFRGSTYSSSNTTNFIVDLPSNLEFSSILLPDNQIIFSKTSGVIANYNGTNNSITLRNTTNNETQTITLNQIGAIVSVN